VPRLGLQFVPAVRGQCGHLRGQSRHRTAPDGSRIDNLHVRAAGASQIAARLSLKRLIETNGRTVRALKCVPNFAQHRR
jgi:hypothetical protein